MLRYATNCFDGTANLLAGIFVRAGVANKASHSVGRSAYRRVVLLFRVLVRQAQTQGAPSVTTDVLPHVSVDLASYSAWDTKDSPANFAEALSFIAKHKRATEPYGQHGVFIGEFGLPESEASPEIVLDRTTSLLEEAKRFGCPYAVYWQLYCNESIKQHPKANADYKGFWLVRPDGTRSPVCRLFQGFD